MGIQGINPHKIPQRVAFTGNTSELGEIGRELVGYMKVKAKDPNIRAILERLEDLSTIKFMKVIPEKREGMFLRGDREFGSEVGFLIKEGVIQPYTMVITDTGHDIPILAKILKNKNLRFNSVFISRQFDHPEVVRIVDQAYTFGQEIQKAELEIDKPNGLFIGIDAHRRSKIDATQLPSFQELKGLGITRVIDLNEAHSKNALSNKDTNELEEYYRNLEKEGLEVLYKGLDTRKRAGTGSSNSGILHIKDALSSIPCKSLYSQPYSSVYY